RSHDHAGQTQFDEQGLLPLGQWGFHSDRQEAEGVAADVDGRHGGGAGGDPGQDRDDEHPEPDHGPPEGEAGTTFHLIRLFQYGVADGLGEVDHTRAPAGGDVGVEQVHGVVLDGGHGVEGGTFGHRFDLVLVPVGEEDHVGVLLDHVFGGQLGVAGGAAVVCFVGDVVQAEGGVDLSDEGFGGRGEQCVVELVVEARPVSVGLGADVVVDLVDLGLDPVGLAVGLLRVAGEVAEGAYLCVDVLQVLGGVHDHGRDVDGFQLFLGLCAAAFEYDQVWVALG